MAKDSQHVLPHDHGKWAVKKDGASRASKLFSNKKEAVEWAQSLARNQSTDLYVHSDTGRITEKYGYGDHFYSVSLESRSGRNSYIKRDGDGKIIASNKKNKKRGTYDFVGDDRSPKGEYVTVKKTEIPLIGKSKGKK